MKNSTRYLIIAGLFALALASWTAPAGAHSTKGQIVKLQRIEAKHVGTLTFFANHRWLAVPSKQKCWQATGWHRRKVCRIARREIAEARARLANIRRTIEKLSVVSGPLGNTSAWNCIHRYERDPAQGWATRTGNGYYGGLQMDLDFQQAHGLDLYRSKGTANNWTAEEQMMVAQRAHDGIRTYWDSRSGTVKTYREGPRGYNPWPNTARTCGLL